MSTCIDKNWKPPDRRCKSPWIPPYGSDADKLMRFMERNGFSIGHARTLDGLLEELERQVKELRK